MGLGSTAKKLQNLVDVAEDLYSRVNDLRDRLVRMEQTIDETNDTVTSIESEVAELRAVTEAIADDQGIDVQSVIDDIDTGEATDEDSSDDQNSESGAG